MHWRHHCVIWTRVSEHNLNKQICKKHTQRALAAYMILYTTPTPPPLPHPHLIHSSILPWLQHDPPFYPSLASQVDIHVPSVCPSLLCFPPTSPPSSLAAFLFTPWFLYLNPVRFCPPTPLPPAPCLWASAGVWKTEGRRVKAIGMGKGGMSAFYMVICRKSYVKWCTEIM